MLRAALARAVISALCIGVSARGTCAEDAAAKPHFELWAGGQAFEQAWSLYSGVSVAPFGAIQEDGWRVRAVGGYGGYSYASGTAKFHGTVSFADLLIGYHKQLGPVTLKVLAGLTVAEQDTDDPQAAVEGFGSGGKAVLEGWWNASDRIWASLDMSLGTLSGLYDNTYSGRLRVGWRLTPELSVGLETAAAGNDGYDSGRLGAFVRYEWASGEVYVSGGFASDSVLDDLTRLADPGYLHGVAQGSTPFATASWLTRF